MKFGKKTQKFALAMGTVLTASMVPEVAHAQMDVEVYGLVGAYIGSVKRSDTTQRTTIEGNGGLTTPYLGFRGTEDLGDGLSAIFQLENFFQVDTGAAGRSSADPTFASRSSWVGLRGRLGQLTFGRHTTQYYLAMQAINPFQSSVNFSPLVVQSYTATFGATVSGDTVWNNAVQYVTPDFGGLTAVVQQSLGETPGASAQNNSSLTLRYVNGPWLATGVAQRVRIVTVAPSTSQVAYLGGLSYDFGAIKLYGSAESTERNISELKSRTYQIGASIPVSAPAQVLVSWARTRNISPVVSDTLRNTATLGYDYFLSKRTDLYAIYMYDKLTANVTGNTYALGIRHTF